MKPTWIPDSVESRRKQLLADVRALDGSPGPLLKSRIYESHSQESDFGDWDYYPAWSFHPRFLSPVVRSELVIYDGTPAQLLRCAPGFSCARSERPDCYRALVVPEHLAPFAWMIGGVSRLHIMPADLDEEERVNWVTDTFENQSYERLLNLSSEPRGAWFAQLIAGEVDSDRREGIFFSGVKPVIKAGPSLYLYFRSIRWERSLPISLGPFHGLLFGVTDYHSNGGIEIPDESQNSAQDFHRGLNKPDRPLAVLSPPENRSEQTARRWAQWAGYLLEQEKREVVIFSEQGTGLLGEQVDRQTAGRATFANRWLTTWPERCALLQEAEAVVTGDLITALCTLRAETPLCFVGEEFFDLMNPGDIRLSLEQDGLDPTTIGRLYQRLISSELDDGETESSLSCSYQVQKGDMNPFLSLPESSPPETIEEERLRDHILRECEYRLFYILNNLVRLEIPRLEESDILRRYRRRFGTTIDRSINQQVCKDLRRSLSSLEKKVLPELKGFDPSPPPGLSGEEEQWFGMLQPLWVFRGVVDGEEKEGKIAWGMRYFFNGCRSAFNTFEEM